MKLTRAARERTTQAPDSVWCIFDTHEGLYIQKRQHSGFMKTIWTSKGAAKNAAVMLIQDEFSRRRKENGETGYSRPPCFRDQTRYEVHEMALKPVMELPRYYIDTDGDGNYFLIPVKRRADWVLWVQIGVDDPEDPRAWEAPGWAKPVEVSGVTFENPKEQVWASLKS